MVRGEGKDRFVSTGLDIHLLGHIQFDLSASGQTLLKLRILQSIVVCYFFFLLFCQGIVSCSRFSDLLADLLCDVLRAFDLRKRIDQADYMIDCLCLRLDRLQFGLHFSELFDKRRVHQRLLLVCQGFERLACGIDRRFSFLDVILIDSPEVERSVDQIRNMVCRLLVFLFF